MLHAEIAEVFLFTILGLRIYKIDDANKVKEHIDHKVTIDGDVDGDTVQISSLKMAE